MVEMTRRRSQSARVLAAYAAGYIAFLYLPVLLIPVFSINTSVTPTLPLQGFTLDWYRELPSNKALLGAVWNSLYVGVATSLVATILGFCAARAVSRHRFRGKRAMNGLIMMPLVLPEIIIAISLLLVFLQAGLPLSLVTVVLGHVLICLPYAMVVMISGFQGFDASLEEVSLDLGETSLGTLRRVTLPILMPAIVASLLVSFTISLDEFIIAFFLSGTEPTLPIYVWSQLRFAARLPSVLALGSLLLLASFVLLGLGEIFRRRAVARMTGDGGFS